MQIIDRPTTLDIDKVFQIQDLIKTLENIKSPEDEDDDWLSKPL